MSTADAALLVDIVYRMNVVIGLLILALVLNTMALTIVIGREVCKLYKGGKQREGSDGYGETGRHEEGSPA